MKNRAKPSNFLQFIGLFFSFFLSFYLVFPVWGQDSSAPPWSRFFQSSDPPPTEPKGNDSEGGARGDDICPIAPNKLGVLKVWNLRPMLTWSGEVTKLEIRELDSRTDLWNQRISSNNKVLSLSSDDLELYQITVETDLQPGQTYKWYFSDKPSGEYDEYLPLEFAVMTDQERESIALELQQLEQELTAQNVTGDGAKLRRADYFASQNLWLEFWQEVLSVESPSEDLKALLASTIGELCE